MGENSRAGQVTWRLKAMAHLSPLPFSAPRNRDVSFIDHDRTNSKTAAFFENVSEYLVWHPVHVSKQTAPTTIFALNRCRFSHARFKHVAVHILDF